MSNKTISHRVTEVHLHITIHGTYLWLTGQANTGLFIVYRPQLEYTCSIQFI